MFNWKLNKKKRQVEAKVKAGNNGTSVTMIVGLDGYDYNHYTREHQFASRRTGPYNIHLSMNGPLQLTFEELERFAFELTALANEGRLELERTK